MTGPILFGKRPKGEGGKKKKKKKSQALPKILIIYHEKCGAIKFLCLIFLYFIFNNKLLILVSIPLCTT
jgi:hypothetical protein